MPPATRRKPSITHLPRTVIGYHGCSEETAVQILAEQRFQPSTKAYDWLGEGVYFWEFAPYRALEWAIETCARRGGQPAVLRAVIRLGRCLNLLDVEHIPRLVETYDALVADVGVEQLPRNTERGAHFLDRLVIDTCCRSGEERLLRPFQSVRGSFPEGKPIYPGSKILTKAHTQIAVRDVACISQISLVQFD